MNKALLLLIGLVTLTLMTQQGQADPLRRIRHESFDITRITPEQLLANEAGDRVDLSHLQLEGEAGDAQLELERFNIFSSNAEVLIHEDSKIHRKALPKGAYYHGRVSGHQDSLAVISVDDNGKTQGIVQLGDRVWLLNDDRPNRRQRLHLKSRSMPDQALASQPSEPMRCGLDTLKQSENSQQSTVVSQALPLDPSVASLPAGQLFRATIAIESDGEFYALFGNAESATAYIANLFAFASTLYEREAQTRLTLGQINLWPNAATDPWTFTTTSAGLTAFRSYWISNKPTVNRSTAHFLSGKNLGGGIAYINALCSTNNGYGLSASLSGNFNISNPQPLWDIIVVTHEIGHNFNSQHTHDYQNIGGDPNPVDSCPSGSLPGLYNLTGGAAGAGNGTIMSYCHQLAGGYRNISLTFGQSPFAYGIKPYRVSDVMSNYVAQQAASYPGCLPVLANSYELAVTKTGSGPGTLASSPTGINCGSTCSANFSTGTSVTLTATPDTSSTFYGWSGCDSTSGATCNVSMSAARSVMGRFDVGSHTLTVSKSGAGTGSVTSVPEGISCGSTCSASFPASTVVTLTAAPDNGSGFSSWTGCDSTAGSTCNVSMSAVRTMSATFHPTAPYYSLSVSTSGSGSVLSDPNGILCPTQCSATYLSGTEVTLYASAATGYYFTGWTGACLGLTVCTVSLTGNQSVTANFASIPPGSQLLSVSKTGSGTITSLPTGINCGIGCSYPYAINTVVTLFAVAEPGNTFTGWSGACTGKGGCMVTIDSRQSVKATFKNNYLMILPIINDYLNR